MTIFSTVEDKPQELLVTALARGRLCELLGPELGEHDRDALFTLGLFSVVDGLMDEPMEDLLADIPFAPEMVDALVWAQEAADAVFGRRPAAAEAAAA
jgi:EAL and modified HD-GYP domain-containing signal transduction protein